MLTKEDNERRAKRVADLWDDLHVKDPELASYYYEAEIEEWYEQEHGYQYEVI